MGILTPRRRLPWWGEVMTTWTAVVLVGTVVLLVLLGLVGVWMGWLRMPGYMGLDWEMKL